jgi:acetylornithine deacetylase/succinyl-diaminopimelate desuccinylase-like protein
MDFRLVPDQTPESVLELLQAHLRDEGFDDVEVSVIGTAEAAGTSIEDPFVQRVIHVAEATSGKRASIMPRLGGSLPIIASLQRHLEVPGVAAPGNPFYFGARVHAPNEHVRRDDLGQAIRFTYALIQELAHAG